VPAGEFTIGSDPAVDPCARDYNQPQHSVFLSDFYVGRYEVTNSKYYAFLDDTGQKAFTPSSGAPDLQVDGNRPSAWVTQDDAIMFARWLSEQTGLDFQLPSEAEWEKACRGTDGRIYPWGDSEPDAEVTNFSGHLDGTTQVGSYSPQGDSPYGLADMAGNVWDWTGSLFEPYPYEADDGREDMDDSGLRVMRGGAFYYGDRKSVRCAGRDKTWMVASTFRDNDVGFRLVLHP
jgi:formylglycine-generating enzyme required for sulfatase activity